VLIAGGEALLPPGTPVAEIFDPTTGAVTPVTGDLSWGWGIAVELADGRVLATVDNINTDPRGVQPLFLIDPKSATSVRVAVPGEGTPYPFANLVCRWPPSSMDAPLSVVACT